MSRLITSGIAAITVAAAGSLVIGIPTSAVGTSTDGKTTATRYGMEASGYASRVIGGDVPAGSDRSAFQVIACTNRAGLDKSNAEAVVDLGEAQLDTTKTHVWTSETRNTVSSWSRHTIDKVTLGSTTAGILQLNAVTSTSHVWHDNQGFHAKTVGDLGSIVLKPRAGVNQRFPVPSPGESVTVPGVGTITLSKGDKAASSQGASAMLDAVRVRLSQTGTKVFLAHSRATIRSGITTDIYKGSSYASKANLVDGTVTSGKTPLTIVPCVGSRGMVTKKSIAHTSPFKNVSLGALTSTQQSGATNNGRPEVTTTARVGRVNLGNGLVVTAVEAKAHIERTSNGLQSSAKGTNIGRVLRNGNELRIPNSGVLRIRGVAKLETSMVKRTQRSIAVVSLRVTLLDARSAVIDLGVAKAGLGASGL